jgi:hypothetical protein
MKIKKNILIPILLDDGGLKEKFNDEEGKIVGRWAGDRIRFVGDYGNEEGDVSDGEEVNPYGLANYSWTDISKEALKIMVNDKLLYAKQDGGYKSIKERLEE